MVTGLYLGWFLISGMQANKACISNIQWLLFGSQDLLGWVGAETHQIESFSKVGKYYIFRRRCEK